MFNGGMVGAVGPALATLYKIDGEGRDIIYHLCNIMNHAIVQPLHDGNRIEVQDGIRWTPDQWPVADLLCGKVLEGPALEDAVRYANAQAKGKMEQPVRLTGLEEISDTE